MSVHGRFKRTPSLGVDFESSYNGQDVFDTQIKRNCRIRIPTVNSKYSESTYKKTVYNEVGITSDSFSPPHKNICRINLAIKKPRYSENSLSVPWIFVICRPY